MILFSSGGLLIEVGFRVGDVCGVRAACLGMTMAWCWQDDVVHTGTYSLR